MRGSGYSEVLAELHASAVATYGEARAGEDQMREALGSAATAVWRVERECPEPLELEPWRDG